MIRARIALMFTVILTTNASAQTLSGTYTIGGSRPSYVSFTEAVTDLATKGVSGAVIFNVRNGTYTEQIDLPAISGASASNTITFQSESGTMSSVTLAFAQSQSDLLQNYVFLLNGASHVRIKNLTMASTGTGTTQRSVLALRGNVHDVVVQGDSLLGYAVYSIHPYFALLTGHDLPMADLTVIENKFTGGSYGVYIDNGTGRDTATGTVIRGNTFLNSAGFGGIYLLYNSAPVIDSNTISCVSDAIHFLECGNSSGVDQLLITRNRIVNTNGGSGIKLSACKGNLQGSGLVANNFVTMLGSNNAYGISVADCQYLNVYYNSVNVVGASKSYAFYETGGSNQNVVNNIFMNPAGGYAYDVFLPGEIATSNWNDLYTTGAKLAYWNGDCANLAALQAASNNDLRSVTDPTQFLSPTDLHLTGTSVGDNSLRGTPLTEVAADIDGQVRSATDPYMGADEGSIALAVDDHSLPGQNGMQLAPIEHQLMQNYPNPFNPSTTICYGLPQRSHVLLTIFTTLGQQVTQLVDGDMEAGYHEVRFDGTGLASGVYLYRLQAGRYMQTRKFVFIR